jgi:hypothetical protein
MEMISNIEPVDIINAMFLKALRALYTKESAVAKKVLTEVVKDSTSQQEKAEEIILQFKDRYEK